MVTYAGQGDPRRTMELLWGVPSAPASRGPKPAFTVDDIVAAATDIADTEGFDAVSMRSVGERLGRTAMALYTYVPGKAELVDLMLDRALRELDVTYDVTDGWRAAARRWALDLWDFYLRHPWVHQISSARPVLGPGSYVTMERPAELFASTDLTGADVMKIVGTVSGFVAGMTRQIAELREATRAVGQTEMDWWTTQSELISELVPDVELAGIGAQVEPEFLGLLLGAFAHLDEERVAFGLGDEPDDRLVLRECCRTGHRGEHDGAGERRLQQFQSHEFLPVVFSLVARAGPLLRRWASIPTWQSQPFLRIVGRVSSQPDAAVNKLIQLIY